MADRALQIVEQRQVEFYGDTVIAVAVREGSEQRIYVPLKPICDMMGVEWSAQFRRIKRDPVLSRHAQGIAITTIPSGERRTGGRQEMVALPLDYLNGWLFGINADRVKPELRERVIRYQENCYRVLAEAFREGQLTTDLDMADLLAQDTPEAQAYKMAQAVLGLARNQLLMRAQLADHERQLAAHTERLETIETTLGDPGRYVTPEQASMISQAVKAVAMALGKASGRNEHGAVYGEMYRKFGITGYKMLPARRFEEAMRWLTEWHEQVTGQGQLPF